MKQEETSLSGDPCSPSSHLSSSTPSSHCSSRPASPRSAVTSFATASTTSAELGIDTGDLGDCLVDGSEFDQYLPPPPIPNQYHSYRDYSFNAEDEEGSRYHELQPGGQVKPERYCQAASAVVYPPAAPSSTGGYYPGYQYVSPSQGRAPPYSYVFNSAENWTNWTNV